MLTRVALLLAVASSALASPVPAEEELKTCGEGANAARYSPKEYTCYPIDAEAAAYQLTPLESSTPSYPGAPAPAVNEAPTTPEYASAKAISSPEQPPAQPELPPASYPPNPQAVSAPASPATPPSGQALSGYENALLSKYLSKRTESAPSAGWMLCPVKDGVPTKLCGMACYLPAEYGCAKTSVGATAPAESAEPPKVPVSFGTPLPETPLPEPAETEPEEVPAKPSPTPLAGHHIPDLPDDEDDEEPSATGTTPETPTGPQTYEQVPGVAQPSDYANMLAASASASATASASASPLPLPFLNPFGYRGSDPSSGAVDPALLAALRGSLQAPSQPGSNQPGSNQPQPLPQGGNQPSAPVDAPVPPGSNQPQPLPQGGNQPSAPVDAPVPPASNQPSNPGSVPAPSYPDEIEDDEDDDELELPATTPASAPV